MTATATITRYVHPERRHLIDPCASLERDLHLDPIDLAGIACDLDEALGIEITDAAIEAWRTVGDVEGAVPPLSRGLPGPVFHGRNV